MRGPFSGGREEEWCDRRLLARIHRDTRDRKRTEIQPVPPAQFMRFLFRWHQLAMEGATTAARAKPGCSTCCGSSKGSRCRPAPGREDLLPLRVNDYVPSDARQAVRRRAHRVVAADRGERQRDRASGRADAARRSCWSNARPWRIGSKRRGAGVGREALSARGAAGAGEPARARRHLLRRPRARHRTAGQQVEQALGELVAAGWSPRDSFAGLRALMTSEERRKRLRQYRGRS